MSRAAKTSGKDGAFSQLINGSAIISGQFRIFVLDCNHNFINDMQQRELVTQAERK